MEVVTVISTVVMAVVAFTAVSLFCTFPGWVAGKATGRGERDLRANFLVATKGRRWTLWVLGSVTAIVALNVQYRAPGALALLLTIVGSLVAQYAAFCIGFASKTLVMDRHAEQVPGVYQVIPGEVVADDQPASVEPDSRFDRAQTQPLPLTPEDAQAVRPEPTSIEESLLAAEAEGYSRPTPTDH